MEKKIRVIKAGPYLVSGAVPLFRETMVLDTENIPTSWVQTGAIPTATEYTLCRCGSSASKPFCDGTHSSAGFTGEETANFADFLEGAECYGGPALELLDNEKLCAAALFCHRAGDTWTLVEQSADPERRRLAIETAGNCPSGRLVLRDKNGLIIEPELPAEISITDDPAHQVSGPLWVKGGIMLQSADAKNYEVRNRVTLCRCGASDNKPFCDGAHCASNFKE